MATPETKNLDQAPQPATPEELKVFKDLVIDKIKASGKAVDYKDPVTEAQTTTAKWTPEQNIDVHADIGGTHDPEHTEVLVINHVGRVGEIDAVITKHFRYFPLTETSEYEEEFVEYYKGKRLIGEDVQRAWESMPEIDLDSLDEEKKRMIEHAREQSHLYRGSNLPPMDTGNLDEVTAILSQCDPSNAAPPPVFA
ncbi:MAG: hypothetical protein ACRDRL_30745 [Sciscionella sp.]